MRSFNSEIRAAPAVPPPTRSNPPLKPEQESAAGEEDPGSALDTLPETMHDDEDPDLHFMDEDLALPPEQLPEDENADPVGDGHSDAELAATQPPAPPRREAPSAPPRRPEPSPDDEAEIPQEDMGDAESHKPGRD